ncbi:unnamed protein product, partial [Mesorhabditis spiculigera]
MRPDCEDIREHLWVNKSDITLLPETQTIFGVIYSVFITFGVVGNLLVILSVLQNKSLQSVRNVFIVSLSCSDIVVSVVSGSITPITAFSKIWLFGAQLCYLVPLIQGTSLCFSTLTLMAISIDRFFLIIFPTKRHIRMSTAMKLVAFNAGLAMSISFPMFIKQRLVIYENFCGEICTEDWDDNEQLRTVYGTVVFVIQFIFPLVIITFCYSMISIKLSKGVLVRAEEGILTEQRKNAMKRRLRTNRMLIAMVGVFFCCWMPAVAFNFLRDYNWLPRFIVKQIYFYGIVTHCISMSSTVWNPILYALLNEQFRIAFSNLLRSCRNRDNTMKVCKQQTFVTGTSFVRRNCSQSSIPLKTDASDELLNPTTKSMSPRVERQRSTNSLNISYPSYTD